MNTVPGNKYKLEDLIDIKHFQDLQEKLFKIYPFASAVIDNDGNILTATAWQDICTKFHRKNKECEKACIQSDKYITEHLHEANPAITYLCPHGLIDNAIPIIIDNVHYGNFFTGQFLMEKPDMEIFREQAQKYGFAEDAYLEAVKKVPICTKDQLDSYLTFFKGLIDIISEIGLKNLKEIETRKQIEESEEKYRQLFESISDAYASIDMKHNIIDTNTAFNEMLGYTANELRGLSYEDITPKKWHTMEFDIIEKQVLHQGYSVIYEKEYIHKNGTVFPVELRTFLIKDKHGEAKGMSAIVRDISERKKAEEALREREELLNKSQEMASIGSFVWDMVDNKVTWSHNLYKIYGYDEETFSGNILEVSNLLIHPDDVDRANKEVLKMIEDSSSWDVEFRIIRPDGAERVIRSRGEVELDSEDNQIKSFGINQDVTERKLSEDRFQKSEAILKAQFENSPDLIMVLDRKLRFVNLNKILFGPNKKVEELIGKDAIEPLPESAREIVREKVQKCFDTGEIQEFEHEVFGGKWALARVVPLFSNGNIENLMVISTDITNRKLAEIEREAALAALSKSEKKHRTILRTAIDGFLLIDKNGNIVEANEAYCKMSGYSREELIGKNAAILEAAEPSEEMSKEIDEIINKKTLRFIRQHIRKDGSLFDVEISSQFQPEEGFVCFVRDITKTKEMESQLQQAMKMESIGTLAGGIAHDFNNILSPIMMHAEMAMTDLPSDDPLQHCMKEIFNASDRARDLVKQILTFARKGSEKRIPVKVSLIVKEALKFLRSTLPTTINIQHEIESKRDTVLADETQLNQIIINLCTNAAHAMREKGGVLEIILGYEDITASKANRFLALKPGKYLKLTVKDNGTGIDYNILNRIFEPYFTTKKVGEGTGLGLATVHGIVRNYEGDITVESTVGRGTAFHVYLPLIDTEISSVEEKKTEFPKGTEKILLIDDEKAALEISRRMLERFGYKVTFTTSSTEAFEIFREDPDAYDLVITDMTMPNMTGETLAKEIMAIRPKIPLILCTGYSDKIDEEKAKAIGIKAYVMKPIVMGELAKTIRDVLDKE